MINHTNRRHNVLPTSVALFGLVVALLRTVLVFKLKITSDEADPSYYYLKFGGANALFAALFALGCIAVLLAAFAVADDTDAGSSYLTRITKILSLAAGIMTAACTVLYVFGQSEPNALFIVLLLLMALAVAARMISIPLGKIRVRSEAGAYLGMATAAYYAVRILCDFVGQLASPLDMSGAYHFLMLMILMMFWLQETRISLGKQKKTLYILTGLISLIAVPVYALPTLILHFVDGTGTFSQAAISLADLVMCACICSKLCRMFEKSTKKTDNAVMPETAETTAE